MDIDVFQGKPCLIFEENDPVLEALRVLRSQEIMAKFTDEELVVNEGELKALGIKNQASVRHLVQHGLLIENVSPSIFLKYSTTTRTDELLTLAERHQAIMVTQDILAQIDE